MNIFYVDHDPVVAAQSLCNSHVVKMILESAQMLSTAHRIIDFRDDLELYSSTHVNHPCSKWVRESHMNYEWLYDHFIGLLDEYTYRYEKDHKSSRLIPILSNHPRSIRRMDMTTPACAMPEEFIISDDVVINYRNYYNLGKKHLHAWKKREKPSWIV